MTLARLLCLCGLFWWSAITPGVAQMTTVPVRSGEHPEFTRLVIRIPETNPWRIEASRGRAVLLIEGPALRFDVTQSFARIPRTRLQNLIATENRLELELACDCDIRAAEDIPEFLVIDILGPEAESRRHISASLRPRPRPERNLGRDPELAHAAHRAGVSLAQRLRGPTLAPSHALDHSGARLSSVIDENFAELASMPTAPPVMLPEELGRVIARSVAHGMLAPDERVEVAQIAPAPLSGADSRPQPLTATLDQIGAHVAVFPDSLRGTLQSETDAPTEECRAFKDVDPAIDKQGSEKTLPLRASALLHDARDRLDRASVLAQIRSLLAAGFGAEARLHARLLDAGDREGVLVEAMGRIIDHGPAEHAILSGLQPCGTAASLWAFLGTVPHHRGSAFPFDHVVQAIASQPVELRMILAPHVVQALLDAGQHDAAQRVGASVERLGPSPTAARQLLRAALALAEPTPRPEIVMRNTPAQDLPDDILLLLLNRSHAHAEVADPALVAAAENRLFALRGDPLGQDLARLVSVALARAGDYGAAFDLAADRQTGLPPSETATLTRELLALMTHDAEDADFVLNVFDQRPWERTDLEDSLIADMSDRLTQLGFPNQADLLRQTPVPEADHLDRLLESGLASRQTAPEPRRVTVPVPPVADISDHRADEVEQATGRQDAPHGIVPLPGLSMPGSSEAGRERDAAPPSDAGLDPGSEMRSESLSRTMVNPDTQTEDARGLNGGADATIRPALNGPSAPRQIEDARAQDNVSLDTVTGSVAAFSGPENPSPTAAVDVGDAVMPEAMVDDGDMHESGQLGLLAETRSLLEASADLRSQLRALLSDPSPEQE